MLNCPNIYLIISALPFDIIMHRENRTQRNLSLVTVQRSSYQVYVFPLFSRWFALVNEETWITSICRSHKFTRNLNLNHSKIITRKHWTFFMRYIEICLVFIFNHICSINLHLWNTISSLYSTSFLRDNPDSLSKRDRLLPHKRLPLPTSRPAAVISGWITQQQWRLFVAKILHSLKLYFHG